jgi:hypothetical protein
MDRMEWILCLLRSFIVLLTMMFNLSNTYGILEIKTGTKWLKVYAFPVAELQVRNLPRGFYLPRH